MMKRVLAAAAALAFSASLAHAQEVKVGVVLPYTGTAASPGSRSTAAWSSISSSTPTR